MHKTGVKNEAFKIDFHFAKILLQTSVKKNLLWLNQISSPISFPSDAKFIILILVEVFVYVVV